MILKERMTDQGLFVSLCDSEIMGKTFKEGEISLTVTESFYRGEEAKEGTGEEEEGGGVGGCFRVFRDRGWMGIWGMDRKGGLGGILLSTALRGNKHIHGVPLELRTNERIA